MDMQSIIKQATEGFTQCKAWVLREEHRIYPAAVRWFVEGRLSMENGVVRLRDAAERQAVFAAS